MALSTDRLLVTIASKFKEEVVTESGLVLYQDVSFHPEQHATLEGVVYSVPERLRKHGIQEGDKVYFSYLVVFDREFDNTDEVFSIAEDHQPYFQEFANGRRERIRVVRFPNGTFSGVLTNAHGERVDGRVGRAGEVDRWLSQFRIQGDSRVKYNNLLEIDENLEVWRVEWMWVFYYERDGVRHMMNNYCMVTVDKEEEEVSDAGITLLSKRSVISGSILEIAPQKIDIKRGDIVYFDRKYAQHYEIGGQEVFIFDAKFILAKEAL